jgi:hypothetical protein
MKCHVFIFLFYILLFSSLFSYVCMDLICIIMDESIVGLHSCFKIEMNIKVVVALLSLLNSTNN